MAQNQVPSHDPTNLPKSPTFAPTILGLNIFTEQYAITFFQQYLILFAIAFGVIFGVPIMCIILGMIYV